MSQGDLDRHPRDQLRRELSLGAATLLIVSSVIGAGIFFTPGRIAELLPGVEWIFAVWVVGALLSLAGALANAELGAMFPHAGGDYVYLREAYHPAAGFVVGWLTFFAIYAGTIATLAAAFAEGLAPYLGWGSGATLAVACGLTFAASAVNYVGVRWGAVANNLTAVLKVAALLALGLLAPFLGQGDFANFREVVPEANGITLSAFGLALSPVLFSYLGWNASVYVASEIREPGRNVPRSLFLGLALCAGVYLVVNAVYVYALPVSELAGVPNAADSASRALFGPSGATLVTLLVLVSILGTLNAMILIGPRVAYAMALDDLFFRNVERSHPRFHTPHVSIMVQGAFAVALLVGFQLAPGTRSLFESTLDYTVFAIILATLADVLALYRLRRTQPERPRPYRAWGYPWVPALYIVAHLWIAAVMLKERPGECAIGLLVAASGLPVYAWFRARKP